MLVLFVGLELTLGSLCLWRLSAFCCLVQKLVLSCGGVFCVENLSNCFVYLVSVFLSVEDLSNLTAWIYNSKTEKFVNNHKQSLV